MDHVKLTPYAFPDGMAIPRLMPFQEFPWNGDGILAAEVLRLKAAHGLSLAIETGTCLGSTTLWLADNFPYAYTFETHEPYLNIARARFGKASISSSKRSSVPGLEMLYGELRETAATFLFLDAHWGPNCPLLDELEAIAKAGVKPCIVIHDFQVPGTDFGYDKMPDGRPFNLDLVREHMNAIYGKGGWKHNYPTKVEGARRGWISIEPVQV